MSPAVHGAEQGCGDHAATKPPHFVLSPISKGAGASCLDGTSAAQLEARRVPGAFTAPQGPGSQCPASQHSVLPPATRWTYRLPAAWTSPSCQEAGVPLSTMCQGNVQSSEKCPHVLSNSSWGFLRQKVLHSFQQVSFCPHQAPRRPSTAWNSLRIWGDIASPSVSLHWCWRQMHRSWSLGPPGVCPTPLEGISHQPEGIQSDLDPERWEVP